MKRETGAIAIDLGATSARFAAGWLEDGSIHFDVIAQTEHKPIFADGREIWDIAALTKFCESAAEYGANTFTECTLGIDTWGVDFGFLDESGVPEPPVVSYRDSMHLKVFSELEEHRSELFQLTGIQHQPFNTIYQLVARRERGDDVNKEWVFLPSWLARTLGFPMNNEWTMASTSQLLGADGQEWCDRAFEIARVPLPKNPPCAPGKQFTTPKLGVAVVQVAGHDTACAVHGLGELSSEQAFISLGTWSLLGCMLDRPLLSREAEIGGFSNERAVDGRVRFLSNVAGFYVVNRLHHELRIKGSIPDWIRSAHLDVESVNLRDERFFNPPSMASAICEALGRVPDSEAEWVGIAVVSIARSTAQQLKTLEALVGHTFNELRVSGGPIESELFCDVLSTETQKKVVAGPKEATILGNLAQQLGADSKTVARSAKIREYFPET
jgi:rhamnulokinase